jgi:hypothetical protein
VATVERFDLLTLHTGNWLANSLLWMEHSFGVGTVAADLARRSYSYQESDYIDALKLLHCIGRGS